MEKRERLSDQITLQQAMESNFDDQLTPGEVFAMKEELYKDPLLFDATCAEIALSQLDLEQQSPPTEAEMEMPIVMDPREDARRVGEIAARLSSMLCSAVDIAQGGSVWPYSNPSASVVLIAKENVQRRLQEEQLNG